uniref:Uncharacterized protein n=1 Tax=Strongyloides papillosus TaxID=174720 RepID=A0A0N5B759_STREA
MSFLKVLTVFIVCISIFRVISKSAIVEDKDNSTGYNAVITGRTMCPYCKEKESVTVFLYHHYKGEWFNKKCNESFFIEKYIESHHKEAFNATFHFRCEYEVKREIKNKWPKNMLGLNGVYYYYLGFIDFRTTEERKKNRKRKNSSRKRKF